MNTWKQSLPEGLAPKVAHGLLEGEELALHVPSDVGEDMRYGERWLVATNRRLLVWGRAGAADPSDGFRPLVEVPLDEVEDARVEPVVGGGVLLVKTRAGRSKP